MITDINPSIFRAYDIRGIVDEANLNSKIIFSLGRAIGTLALEIGEQRIVIGRDGRLSGPDLIIALQEGLIATGIDVVDIGIVPTPLLYYATHTLDTRSGIMLTGSHNPAQYNGLKIVINGKTLTKDAIQNLYQRILANNFQEGFGWRSDLEVIERYITHVARNIHLHKKLKVVVDCGNGVAGLVAPELYKRLGCEVYELFCDVDGNFPNHHPDPSQIENLNPLISKVCEVNADLGLAFDGDGDRLGVVTNKGEVVLPDRQLMLFAKAILAKNKGAKIIYDVKCSNLLGELIKQEGGEPIMWKTGHSLIKAKLAESHALLAGEMSGHIFVKERWYGFDDALYAGARLLEILSLEAEDIDTIFKKMPNSVNTPELKIPVSDTEKFTLMEKLIAKADFQNAKDILTIDGLRVNFDGGWGLVRPSNTTPCLVLRFEALNETTLKMIQDHFRAFILNVDPSLELPF